MRSERLNPRDKNNDKWRLGKDGLPYTCFNNNLLSLEPTFSSFEIEELLWKRTWNNLHSWKFILVGARRLLLSKGHFHENIRMSMGTFLKMDYNKNSHIKLTIEPCLCCVQVTIYCCGNVFLFIILLQFDRKNETPLLRFLKFPALHWFPTKTH